MPFSIGRSSFKDYLWGVLIIVLNCLEQINAALTYWVFSMTEHAQCFGSIMKRLSLVGRCSYTVAAGLD